ncbi:MAG: 30S ribosomal protein S3, partial [Candidatus Eremiobacteraeota bacterium]|nr:30S ribosomal protein S3 [Candidatus Eremiobacteraeota bacterium]
YIDWLHEDVAIRNFFNKWMRSAAISKIEIERRANQARVIINTAKPGIIIGKRGVGIEDIRKNLEALTKKNVQVNVVEIKHPELDARLVGQNIVDQLEKRIAFRRAMKQAIMRTMKAGARGVKVQVSGRLGGAEIARTERNADGKVPLHTLRADIDYAHVEAFTTFGRIGVKVWIYRGEVLPDQPRTDGAMRERGGRGDRRERGGRGGRGRPGIGSDRPAPAPRQAVAPADTDNLPEPASIPEIAPQAPVHVPAEAAAEIPHSESGDPSGFAARGAAEASEAQPERQLSEAQALTEATQETGVGDPSALRQSSGQAPPEAERQSNEVSE